MTDKNYMVLSVVVAGENIMSNPLLRADGVAFISGKAQVIKVETPITSIADFVETFKSLFKED